MLFAGWEVRIVKNCDRGLENADLGHSFSDLMQTWDCISGSQNYETIQKKGKKSSTAFIKYISKISQNMYVQI